MPKWSLMKPLYETPKAVWSRPRLPARPTDDLWPQVLGWQRLARARTPGPWRAPAKRQGLRRRGPTATSASSPRRLLAVTAPCLPFAPHRRRRSSQGPGWLPPAVDRGPVAPGDLPAIGSIRPGCRAWRPGTPVGPTTRLLPPSASSRATLYLARATRYLWSLHHPFVTRARNSPRRPPGHLLSCKLLRC